MAYLLMALAFMASILFYSFYPRSDGIEMVDKPAAKATVFELLAQHSAAVSAATVLIVPPKDAYSTTPIKQDYQNNWSTFNPAASNQGMLEYGVYELYIPPYTRFDEGSLRPETFLLCLDNDTGKYSSNCAKKTGLGSTDLLITLVSLYALSAEYGPQYTTLVERALGESTYLSNYDHQMTKNRCRKYNQTAGSYDFVDCPANYTINANGTLTASSGTYLLDNKAHLTTNCGIISYKQNGFDVYFGKDYDPNANYVLSNTRHETVAIPRTFTNNYNKGTEGAIGNRTHLACITELHSTYAGCCDIELPTDSASCAASGCTWNGEKSLCVCGDTYKSNICGVANTGKFGCKWQSGKCVSVCSERTTQEKCEKKNTTSDPVEGVRYGCIWDAGSQKCTSSCGNMSVRPAAKASPGSL